MDRRSSNWLTVAPRRWLKRLGATVGGPCEVCRLWSMQAFCSACLSRHGAERARCAACAMPMTQGASCPGCAIDPPPFERALVAFDYGFPWDRLIGELKFNGRTELAAPLAAALADAILSAEGTSRIDLLLPVPLAPGRLAERGYNQSALLAQHLADRFARPCPLTWLQRPVETAHQVALTREERARNLRGVFMVDPARRAQLAGRRVALVDDVMTTGATAREAAAELLRAGVAAVDVWAVARTP